MRTSLWIPLLLLGCAAQPPAPRPETPTSRLVPVEHLRLPARPDQERVLSLHPGVWLIRDAHALGAFWKTLAWRLDQDHAPTPPPPVLEFKTHQVVLISWGRKPTSEFALRVRSVRVAADRVVVDVRTFGPRVGEDSQGGRPSWPFAAVVVPRRPRVDVRVGGDRSAELVGGEGGLTHLDFTACDVALRFGKVSDAAAEPTPRVFRLSGLGPGWPAVRVFRSAEELRLLREALRRREDRVTEQVDGLWEQLPWARSPLAALDFTRRQVVMVGYGWKPNDGYGLRLRRVRREGEVLKVEVETSVPGPESMPSDVETAPSLVFVAPASERVEVVVGGPRFADAADDWEREKLDFTPGRYRIRMAEGE